MAVERDYFPSLIAPIGDPPSPEKIKTSLDPCEAAEVVRAAMVNISDRVVGRQNLVEQTLLALLTREHQLIFARTGTAKSLYAKTVFAQFAAKTFSIQFTRETPEEAVFGGIDLRKFKQGTLWHDTAGSLVTADLAFLDELFDANDYILRVLLGILNERIFSKGKQQETSPLHTVIATTNYLRRTDLTEPVIDRFIFQARIIPEMRVLEELLIDKVYEKHGGRVISPKKPLPMEIPRELARIVKGENKERLISASFAILFLKDQIIRRYRQLDTVERKKADSGAEEVFVSPRTIAKCRDVLNASALLHHRFAVTFQDLPALRFALTAISGGDSAKELSLEEKLFLQAWDDILSTYSSDDLEQIEQLMKILALIEGYQKGEKYEAIKSIKPTKLRTILQLLGVLSWQDVTEQTFVSTLERMKITKPAIDEIRQDLIKRIKENAR